MDRYVIGQPAAGPRTKAALITFAVSLAAAVIVGGSASVFLLLMGDRSGMDMTGTATSFVGTAPVDSLPVRVVADIAICVAIALVASRMGRGAVGDSLYGITAVTGDGQPAQRSRVVLNALLPIVVWVVARFPLNNWLAILVVTALWLPALVRVDRRSTFSLLTGTHFQARVSAPGVRRGWDQPGAG